MDLINYNIYVMGRQEKLKYILMAAVGLFFVGIIFFNNVIIALLFSLGSFLYPKYKSQQLLKKRKHELNFQFKNALLSLSSSLSVGKSLEGAFADTLKDLLVFYIDRDTYIVKEFEYICRRIELNEPVEIALQDFAVRSGLEDIKNFADVLVICKHTGGNLVHVVKNTSNIISDKIEIAEDIDLVLSKQKYEQKILNLMPLIFIALIKFGGSGYIDSLYTSAKGYFLMALSLTIIGISFLVSKKILDIEV